MDAKSQSVGSTALVELGKTESHQLPCEIAPGQLDTGGPFLGALLVQGAIRLGRVGAVVIAGVLRVLHSIRIDAFWQWAPHAALQRMRAGERSFAWG